MTVQIETAVRHRSLKRIVNKLAISLSMGRLVPSSIRVRLLMAAGVNIQHPKSTFVGDTVYFDDMNPERITIGRRCLITSGVKFLTHFFDTSHAGKDTWPYNFVAGSIEIGDFVFVGSGSVFAKSVKVGSWAVIGANTVVTKDVPEGAIFCGNPGVVIGYRAGFDRAVSG